MKNKSFKENLLNFIMLISGTISVLIAFGDIIINKFIEMKYDIVVNSSEAQSIGIIGGADGPTVIFLAGSQGSNSKIIWMIVFVTIAIGCYGLKRKTRSR